MLKRDVFFSAFRSGDALRKDWVIDAFAVSRPMDKSPEPWDIVYLDKEVKVYADIGEGVFEWVVIEDANPAFPVFNAQEPLELKAGEVPNLTTDVTTTYGDLFFNWRVLVYAFGANYEYVVGPINVKALEKVIARRMTDDPDAGQPLEPTTIYVKDYLRYGQAICDLAGFTQLWVPAASAKAFTTHPDMRALRDRLLEENKDRLHDPAVVAEIQNKMVALDKEWLKGDPSEGFFLGDKVWNTARKRMFLIHGPEAGFNEGGNAELVINSLNEGWDINKLPAMINSLRAGSYYRGFLTALGGESVKFFMRVFQNTAISEQDCGSVLGLIKLIDGNQLDDYEGMFQVEKGISTRLDYDTLKQLVGKEVVMRSPQFCRTGHADYCEKCMGVHNSENANGLGSMASDIGSMFMSIMMGSAHAKELKTAPLKYDTFLT